MKTSDLIGKLSSDLKPVRSLSATLTRTGVVMFAMSVGLALSALFFTARPDLHEAMSERQFIFGAGALILGWIVESYSLALLQLPTTETKKFFAAGLTIVGILALAYLGRGLIPMDINSFMNGADVHGVKCSLDIAFLSVLPGIFLFLILRKGAPTRIMHMALNLAICCAILGAFALQFFCPINQPIHLLVWHLVVPFAALSGIGILIGRKILRW